MTLDVAVGIIIKNQQVFVQLRDQDAAPGGLWEFPGGKIEAGETAMEALAREFKEEVGIDVHAAEPLCELTHQYPDYTVNLYVYSITQFSGELTGAEGQEIAWVDAKQLGQLNLPGANGPIVAKVLARLSSGG